MSDGKFDDFEFAINQEDRCPVVLLLDVSGSMFDDGKIDRLNEGLISFKNEIMSDPITSLRVEVSIITFGGSVNVVHEFSSAELINLPPLQAMGATPLGEAVDAALAEIEHRKAEYRTNGINYYRPWIWILTDGAPTDDDWQSAAERAREAEANRKATVFCVGIGRDANLQVLAEFSSRPPLRLEGLQFREMFKWLSGSLAKVSQAKAGVGDQVSLPPVQGWGTVMS
ncbi:vWA domain-containing protein [Oryzibacter oryziterrae]|uniref:vWA domain-containing protein n=1 Tax=Oryzibacter oryziterrae TaxID=2766474 RepID=UPI001F233FF6|nr:VWA domain-containing protein [Oryzibacter oryziterrae]